MPFLDNFRQVFLPYNLREVEPGRWVALNREYKLLGCPDARVHFDYADYTVDMHIPPSVIRAASDLSGSEGRQLPGNFWLYSDNSVPNTPANKKKYLQRLALLMDLPTKKIS